jgi:hypothetical protein
MITCLSRVFQSGPLVCRLYAHHYRSDQGVPLLKHPPVTTRRCHWIGPPCLRYLVAPVREFLLFLC